MKQKKGLLSTIILVIVFFVGLSVMLYPVVSDYFNSRRQNREIVKYDTILNDMSVTDYAMLKKEAENYNAKLKEVNFPLENYSAVSGYEEILDVTKTGIIGYVSIPDINVELPVYHGTSEDVLNVAVGHVQGTSFPIGGLGNHAVISAHRGLPSAKLFSDLDQLEIGDTFTITVLNEIFTYAIDNIAVVYPHETELLEMKDGKDYVTLVTCTPYGINTHRMLVRGVRVEIPEKVSVRVSADAIQAEEELIVSAIIILGIGIMVKTVIAVKSRKRKRVGEEFEKDNN